MKRLVAALLSLFIFVTGCSSLPSEAIELKKSAVEACDDVLAGRISPSEGADKLSNIGMLIKSIEVKNEDMSVNMSRLSISIATAQAQMVLIEHGTEGEFNDLKETRNTINSY